MAPIGTTAQFDDGRANLRSLPQDHELIELEFAEIKAQSLFEKRTLAEVPAPAATDRLEHIQVAMGRYWILVSP